MAVYTELQGEKIQALLHHFGLGALQSTQGITAGTVNSIYRVSASQDDSGHGPAVDYALRILEGRPREHALFEAGLLEHIGQDPTLGPKIPVPLKTTEGQTVLSLSENQQVSIFPWLIGAPPNPTSLSPDHLHATGEVLAHFHRAQAGFAQKRDNPYGPGPMLDLWRRCNSLAQSPKASQAEPSHGWPHLLDAIQNIARGLDCPWLVRKEQGDPLPWGIVHGDLFPENTLFDGPKLTAMIDFEMAGMAPLAYDLAVVIAASVVRVDSTPPSTTAPGDPCRIDQERLQALLDGYQSIRTLAESERQALPELIDYIFCRFTLTRIFDFEFTPTPPGGRDHKDYDDFLKRRATLATLREIFS